MSKGRILGGSLCACRGRRKALGGNFGHWRLGLHQGHLRAV